MNGNVEKEILGEYADQGYWLKEYEDHVITVGYKDKEIAAFSQMSATPEMLKGAAERHQAQLRETVEVT